MFILPLFTIAKMWKKPKCPSTDEYIQKIWYIHKQNISSRKEGGAESRWRCGKLRNSRLPITRAPAGRWWGTSTPKEVGGTPEQLGRMRGGVRGKEKWRPDRTSSPEGWLGEGRGSEA